MGISVSGTDSADTVLPHQHRNVQIVHSAPAESRQFGDGPFQQSQVASRLDQKRESRGSEQTRQGIPRILRPPR